ncbi:hypothetical protein DFR67_12645 [Williamsia limnetica]|uniref:DUF8175 domain-containing protein n=1 Tax=Williamsia limnetica TaxID=882452 RepID=A0A318RGC8_WILLI|nr:hypothetical protein [Williamsia limnetica]PYE12037.1 hypothetical protein DFR67_12645 [Williamsia limnetica]
MLATGCGEATDDAAPSTSAKHVDPSTPPTNVQWTTYAGMSIPQADQGPQASQQTVSPTGYQHNGPGAGLAAISATIRMSVAPDQEWAQIAGALAAPGPGRDSWSLERTQISITSAVPDGQAPQVLGYLVDDYTPERAVISIITSQPDGSLTATTTTMAWSPPGDWRRVLPDPAEANPVNPVQVLDAVPAQMIPLPHP